jgi:hypothetical protein
MADWRARSSRRTSRSGSVLTRRGYPRLVNAALAGASPTLADGWSLVPVTRSGTLSSTCATSCASHTASSSSSAGLCELRDARPRCAVDHGAAGTLRLPVVRAGLLDGARDRLLFVLHQALEDAALTPVGLKIARGATLEDSATEARGFRTRRALSRIRRLPRPACNSGDRLLPICARARASCARTCGRCRTSAVVGASWPWSLSCCTLVWI